MPAPRPTMGTLYFAASFAMRETSSVEFGENDEVRTAFFDGAVVLIKKKVLGPVKNGRRAEEFFEFANEAEFIGRRLRRTWNYSENSGMRATPSYGGSAEVC